MNDDALYDEVAKELQAKAMVPGVWTRAFAEAGGELDRARAIYIKYRVEQLAQARRQELEQLAQERSQRQETERQRIVEATKQRAVAGFWLYASGVLAVVFGFLTFCFAMGGIIILFKELSVGGILSAVFFVFIAFLFGLITHECYKAGKRYER